MEKECQRLCDDATTAGRVKGPTSGHLLSEDLVPEAMLKAACAAAVAVVSLREGCKPFALRLKHLCDLSFALGI